MEQNRNGKGQKKKNHLKFALLAPFSLRYIASVDPYLGTLGGGGPPGGGRVLSVGVLGCGAGKRRTRMARALETDRGVEWAGSSRTILLLAPMGLRFVA